MVHIHTGVLLSYKKEHIWVSSNEMDEPRAYYTEWSESERQALYINTYIWNLERWYRWSCMQSSRGDTDTKSRLWGTVGEGEGGTIWEDGTGTHTMSHVKQTASGTLLVVCDSLEGWEGEEWERSTRGRGHVYTYGHFTVLYEKTSQYYNHPMIKNKILKV